MRRSRQQKALGKSVEEELDVLSNRLISSTYEEDKIATLESMHRYALQAPVLAGTMCLQHVFQSMATMDSTEWQLRIIRYIVSGELRTEFTEMLLNSEATASTVFSLDAATAAELCGIFDTQLFFERLASAPGCARFLIALLEKNHPQPVRRFLVDGSGLKEQLVFEGAFEMALERIAVGDTAVAVRRSFEELVLRLLDGSPTNQNYFVESELFKSPLFFSPQPGRFAGTVLSSLLDPTNSRFADIQEKLFIPRLIHRAIEQKRYDFLAGLAIDNSTHVKALVERYIATDVLVEDAEADGSAFLLLGRCIGLISPESICSKSFRINLMLEGMAQHSARHEATIAEAASDMREGKVSVDLLLYMIFMCDSLGDTAEHIQLSALDGLCHSLCLVLFMLNGVPVDFNGRQIIAKLRELRKSLCTTVLLNDFFTETLITTIGELIKEQAMASMGNGTEASADPRMEAGAQSPPAPGAVSMGGDKAILERITETGYQKISDAFGIFKKAQGNGRDTYDL